MGAQLGPGASGPGTPTAGGRGRVGDGTGRDVPPRQGGETGRLGLLHEEAGSASGQTGPGKGRKGEANGVLPAPSQTTGAPFQVPGHGRGSGSLGHKNQSPHKVSVKETSPVVLGTLPPNLEGLGSISGQGNGSRLPQLRPRTAK